MSSSRGGGEFGRDELCDLLPSAPEVSGHKQGPGSEYGVFDITSSDHVSLSEFLFHQIFSVWCSVQRDGWHPTRVPFVPSDDMQHTVIHTNDCREMQKEKERPMVLAY